MTEQSGHLFDVVGNCAAGEKPKNYFSASAPSMWKYELDSVDLLFQDSDSQFQGTCF